MNMYQPLSSDRSDILRTKIIYGIWFGMVLGFMFAVFAWGVDAYRLSRINSLHPWLKFAGGAVPSTLIGGLAGWLSAKSRRPGIAFLLWLAVAGFFAWLTVMLPLQIAPRLLGLMEPDINGLLNYTYYEGFSWRIGEAFGWIAIFVAIAGLLQLPLSDAAIFSTSWLGKLAPMLLSTVLVGISGSVIDGLNNKVLREPIASLNSTIQFVLDHRGQEVDRLEYRKMHLAAFRLVEPLMTSERKLIVSGYDQYLSNIKVLVKFKNAWVECDVSYNQPLNCKDVDGSP